MGTTIAHARHPFLPVLIFNEYGCVDWKFNILPDAFRFNLVFLFHQGHVKERYTFTLIASHELYPD